MCVLREAINGVSQRTSYALALYYRVLFRLTDLAYCYFHSDHRRGKITLPVCETIGDHSLWGLRGGFIAIRPNSASLCFEIGIKNYILSY